MCYTCGNIHNRTLHSWRLHEQKGVRFLRRHDTTFVTSPKHPVAV